MARATQIDGEVVLVLDECEAQIFKSLIMDAYSDNKHTRPILQAIEDVETFRQRQTAAFMEQSKRVFYSMETVDKFWNQYANDS